MRQLSDLAAYRSRGTAPALPVFLSDMGNPLVANLEGCGAWVIPVWGDAPLRDWTPLSGLAVILALRNPSADWAKQLGLAIRDARPRLLECVDWSAPMGERMTSVMR